MSSGSSDAGNNQYSVLINSEGQHSLWPVSASAPAGWTLVKSGRTREACLDYVETHWTDMRPASLIAAMEGPVSEGDRGGEARCVHEMLDEHARRQPDAIAVEQGAVRMTFAELNARANACAHHLRSCGVTPDSLIGLCGPRTPNLVAGLFGILKAGGGYLPIDLSYPDDRIRQVLKDARCPLVLTAGDVPPAGWMQGIGRMSLEAFMDGRAESIDAGRHAGLDRLAVVMYTSGSSGGPKGVALSHRALSACVSLPLRDRSAVTCQQYPFALAAHLADLVTPLADGRSVVMPDTATVQSVVGFARMIRDRGIRRVSIGPSRMPAFLESHYALTALGHVTTIIAGSEPVTPRLVARMRAALPAVTILNVFGITETSGPFCSAESAPETDGPDGVSLEYLKFEIKPATRIRVHALDAAWKPVPSGTVGELAVAGPRLARGYLNDPRLTAERFVADPFGQPGGRMFLTRDRCRIGEDGRVEILGRRDFELKVRGLRVNAEEVERHLEALDAAIDRAVVVVDQSGMLIAHVRIRASATWDAATLRHTMAAIVPPHMVPARVVRHAELPLMASGKVDRAALAAWTTDTYAESSDLSADRGHASSVRGIVASIWADVLSSAGLPHDGNFFEAGGDSLLAMHVVVQVHERLGVEIEAADVFDNPTSEDLAQLIEERLTSLTTSERS